MANRPRVDIHPASAAEIAEIFGEVPYTMKAWAGTVEGELIAIGGFAIQSGRVLAFVNVRDRERYRCYPVALTRIARKAVAEARTKYRHIFAEQGKTEASRRWLKRLGFEPVDDEGTVLLCRN